jgi:hypothetical protein
MAMRVMSFLPGGFSGQAEPLVGAKRVLKQQVGSFPVKATGQDKYRSVILTETRNMTSYFIAESLTER